MLEKRRCILSDKYLDTILAISNLAVTLRDRGQLYKAVKIKKEVLKKRRHILGEEYLDTITVIKNLVITLRDLS